MSKMEIKKFLMHGTFTAKLATVKKDGSPHVVPVWFVLDERKDRTTKKIISFLLHTKVHLRLEILKVTIE